MSKKNTVLSDRLAEERRKECTKETSAKLAKERAIDQARKGATREKKLPLFQKVDLTDQEIRDAADRMADLYDQLGRMEEEAKSLANQYKAKTKELEAQLAQAQLLVRNKYEQRLVECLRTWNTKTCRVVTVRLDTGAIVDDRAMTADERQEKLFPEDDSAVRPYPIPENKLV